MYSNGEDGVCHKADQIDILVSNVNKLSKENDFLHTELRSVLNRLSSSVDNLSNKIDESLRVTKYYVPLPLVFFIISIMFGVIFGVKILMPSIPS